MPEESIIFSQKTDGRNKPFVLTKTSPIPFGEDNPDIPSK